MVKFEVITNRELNQAFTELCNAGRAPGGGDRYRQAVIDTHREYLEAVLVEKMLKADGGEDGAVILVDGDDSKGPTAHVAWVKHGYIETRRLGVIYEVSLSTGTGKER